MIIAVDGPAGAGKSTVCKLLAERLGFVYLDTGAMYRALAWAFNNSPAEAGLDVESFADELEILCVQSSEAGDGSEAGSRPFSKTGLTKADQNPEARSRKQEASEPGSQPSSLPPQTPLPSPCLNRIRGMLERIPLLFSIKRNKLEIFFGQRLLSDELRSPEITEAASRISRFAGVREFLVAWQRKLALQGVSVVAEGRDTATVVFPNADLKVFLMADLQTRAQRRLAEYIEKRISLSLEEMQLRIQERDEADSKRDHSPLRPAQGAVLVDTSHLKVEEVVDLLSELAQNLIRAVSSDRREL